MKTPPPKSTLRIALVGDYNHKSVAHDAIHLAIDDAAAALGVTSIVTGKQTIYRDWETNYIS